LPAGGWGGGMCMWVYNALYKSAATNRILQDIQDKHADQNDYILIANLIQWLLFIHKILFSSTYFEPQVLIFRRIQLYTCNIWYCHSLREFVVACRYIVWVRTVYNCILLKMNT